MNAVRLSDLVLRHAARRLGAGRSEWAQAMAAEAQTCRSDGERLRWAFGCWRASLDAPKAWTQDAYPLALTLGAAIMVGCEWTNDEGPITMLLLGALGVAIGALRPARALVSGALLGSVVSGVLGFEALSGLRPAYEAHPTTFADSLHWTVFVAPAMLAAGLGGGLTRRLRAAR